MEVRNNRGCRPPGPDHFLQWGNTKRLRCVKAHVKDDHANNNNNNERVSTTTTARVADRRNSNTIATTMAGKEPPLPSHRVLRNSVASPFGLRSLNNDYSSSPEKGERQNHYPTKAAGSGRNGEMMVTEKKMLIENQPKSNGNDIDIGTGGSHHQNSQPFVWPKFIIGLSSKEKEEDFMAIKGSKLPQRPKKRSKFLQRTLNLISPGSWLCELSQERYEVREKKTSKKRPRGLKAMVGSIDSDSD